MDRFTELETFVAVADCGGFNAAARQLNKSPPTVTRLIAALEDRVGTRLLTRTTRQIALTEAGARFLADARRLLEDLSGAEASAAGAHQDPQGTLSITAPVNFGRAYVAPILLEFLAQNPNVTARALYLDRVVNLIEEGLDIALRIGALPDSSLTAVRVGAVRRVIVAAPSYLSAFGTPRVPADLASHRIAVASGLDTASRWEFERSTQTTSVQVRPVLRGNTIDSALHAATSGWAIARLLSYQVADAIRSGALVEILPGTEERREPVHLVHAEGTLRSAKIRAFMDFAARGLRKTASGWIF